MRFLVTSSLLIGLLAGPAQAVERGDPAAGKRLFGQCGSCHSIGKDQAGRMGPSLAGVIGRKAGAVPGYEYSQAMSKSGITWNFDAMNEYMKQPMKRVPGTKMLFMGVSKEKDRRDIYEYLVSLPKP